MGKIKLAMIQMEVRGGELEWNLAHAAEMIAEAARQGAEAALLPESMDLGWGHPSSQILSTPIPDGEPCQVLRRCAREHGLLVCSGLTEREGDRVYNAAVLIDRRGNVLCRHRKLNELEIVHQYYAAGDRLNVADTELGRIGLMICADGFARGRSLSRALGYMGAEIILSPCSWAVPPDYDNEKEPYGALWRKSYPPVAREFAMGMVGVSNVGLLTGGPWQGHPCIGCSYAVAATGEEILQGPYGVDAECILCVDMETLPRPARGTGWPKVWKMGVTQIDDEKE